LKDKKNNFPWQLVNRQTPLPEKILLVGETKEIISKNQALEKAEKAGLDLLVLTSQPKKEDSFPVCKIADYRKELFNFGKKLKIQKKGSRKIKVKKRKIISRISKESFIISQIKGWLEEGHSVKISLKIVALIHKKEAERKELILEECQKIISYLQNESETIKLQGEIENQKNYCNFTLIKSKQ
jgi:translation initiation factor IF-3